MTWLPESINEVAISEVPGTNPFAYAPGSYNFGTNTAEAADPTGSGSVGFTVQPPYNSIANVRLTRVDFSVTLPDGQSRMLPIFLRQEKAPPLYAFSDGGATLTLFENFPHGTKLDGMNATNIPEFADDPTAAGKVETLVIEGNFDPSHIAGIKGRQSTLSLSKLKNISLPHFAGAIPAGNRPNNSIFYNTTWLVSFDAPLATVIGFGTFSGCSNLTSVTAPNVTKVEGATYYGCTLLASVDYLPNVTSVEDQAFASCTSLTTIDLRVASSIKYNAFGGCTGLQTVKFGYPGEIDFGSDVFKNVTTTNVALYLHESRIPAGGSMTWNGYTWKSISKYE